MNYFILSYMIAREDFAIIKTTDGEVLSWGKTLHGKLGHGDIIIPYVSVPTKIDFFSGMNVGQIACGEDHVLAICNGGIFSWGLNSDGQLGLGDTVSRSLPTKVEYFGDVSVMKIYCDFNQSYSILCDGNLFGWGAYGGTGLGVECKGLQNIPIRVNIPVGEYVTDLECSRSYKIVITDNNRVYAWGDRSSNSRYCKDYLPYRVYLPDDKKITKISCCGYYAMAIIDNDIYCWGENRYIGQLGLGHSDIIYDPIKNSYFNKNVVDVICYSLSSLIFTNDGNVFICGEDFSDFSEYGTYLRHNENSFIYQTHPNRWNVPHRIDLIKNGIIKKIVTDGCFRCFIITNDGKIFSWGQNKGGNLGLGIDDFQYLVGEPQLVEFFNGRHIVDIITLCNTTYAITDEGDVYSWGKHTSIQKVRDNYGDHYYLSKYYLTIPTKIQTNRKIKLNTITNIKKAVH